ncbi:MAG: NUDIX domain-containing protein [Planctomycetes bacterium]|nr:NUDIX domain-containing protein [Planctomycetota bacterium]
MRIPDALYRQLCTLMPIPCVDLLVEDPASRVLLLRRRNDPARGEWWFPGGRVHHRERRHAAALRKLREECGLEAARVDELGTFDVMFEDCPPGAADHGVTTVYRATVDDPAVALDAQSEAYRWSLPVAWGAEGLHPFVREVLSRFAARA